MHSRYAMFLRTLLIAFPLIVLTACSVPFLSTQNEVPRVYLLEWEPPKPPRFNPEGPSIQVMPLRAAPGANSDAIVYMRTPHQLEQYGRHRWADTPARMLEPLLVRALESSGLFSVVAGPDNRVRTDLRLECKLIRLQQVFDGEQSRVVITLRINVVKNRRSQLIASRMIEVSEPVAEATPYDAVRAANRALDALMTTVIRFVSGSIYADLFPADTSN